MAACLVREISDLFKSFATWWSDTNNLVELTGQALGSYGLWSALTIADANDDRAHNLAQSCISIGTALQLLILGLRIIQLTPLGTLVLFLGISAVANDATLTLFRRFHAHLAINLDLLLFVPTTLVRLALFAKLLQPEQAEPLIAATGVAFLVAVLYAAGGALVGGQVGGIGGADLLGPLATRAGSGSRVMRSASRASGPSTRTNGWPSAARRHVTRS